VTIGNPLCVGTVILESYLSPNRLQIEEQLVQRQRLLPRHKIDHDGIVVIKKHHNSQPIGRIGEALSIKIQVAMPALWFCAPRLIHLGDV